MFKMAIYISMLSFGLLGADNAFCEAYNAMNPEGYKVASDLYEVKFGSTRCDPDKIKIISNSPEYAYYLNIYGLDPIRYQALIDSAKHSGLSNP